MSDNSGNVLKLVFFASRFFYISDIILQRLSLFSNSEINISVASLSSFYVFKDIVSTKQTFADVGEETPNIGELL